MSVASERAKRLSEKPLREINSATGFFGGLAASWREVWERRELLRELVKREIKSRYKDSGLGVLWSFIRPLVQLMVYYLVMGKFLGAQRSIAHFAVFIFTGLTLWGLFSEIVTTGTQSILANAGIIKKVRMPREIFPLASVGSAMFNFVVQLALLIVATAVLAGISWGRHLLYAPMAIVVAIVWATALALVLSAMNVYLRDVQYLVEVGLMLGFWFSPIVYQWSMVGSMAGPLLREIYSANPMTVCILAFQRSIWGTPVMENGPSPEMLYPAHLELRLWVVLAVGLIFFIVAQRVFDRLQRNFAQEI